MTNALIQGYQFLVYSNLYIGFVLGLFSFHGFGAYTSLRADYSLFIATSSVALYSFHALFGLRYIHESNRSDRHNWLKKHRRALWTMTVFLCLLSLIQLARIPHITILLLPAGILTAFYVLPLVGKRLRDYNFTKVFLVSAVVTYLCRFIPQHLNEQASWNSPFLIELLLCFGFIFFLTMPFDFRDRKIERQLQTKIHLSQTNARRAFQSVFIGLGICILSLLLHSLIYPSTGVWRTAEIAALSLAFLATVIPERNRKELFYPLFFEGPLLLMGLFSIYLSV